MKNNQKHWIRWVEPLFIFLAIVLVGMAIASIFWGMKVFDLSIEKKAVDWSTWLNNVAAPFLGLAGTIMLLLNFFRQRKDAEDNHNELLKQKEESDFLQLISLQHQNKASIQANFEGDFFEAFHKDVCDFYRNAQLSQGYDPKKIDEYVSNQYASYYLQYYDYIDHFLLHIDYIYKLVEESKHFEPEDKSNKMKLLSAQLSTNEIFMLFYHYFFSNELVQLDKYQKWHFFERLYREKPKTRLLNIRHKDYKTLLKP